MQDTVMKSGCVEIKIKVEFKDWCGLAQSKREKSTRARQPFIHLFYVLALYSHM